MLISKEAQKGQVAGISTDIRAQVPHCLLILQMLYHFTLLEAPVKGAFLTTSAVLDHQEQCHE